MTTTSLENAIYRDASRPVSERVADLLGRMTLEEKIAQLGSVWVYEVLQEAVFSPARAQNRIGLGIGQITRIGGASNSNPRTSAELANTIQRFLLENTRLGIPAMVHEESCSGYMAMGATCFPQIIGVASTWEPALVEQMGTVIRQQMRAVGGHQTLAPVLDVVRDARWGRVEETFGEDPHLVARMGTAYVKGVQSDDYRAGVLATGKHFLGYGVTEGGMNWAPAHVGWREIREVFLPPFEAAIKHANLASVMNAYHEIDGIPLATSEEIFRRLLRDEMGFEGLVVSDYFAIDMIRAYHYVTPDKAGAAAMALRAGIDVELPSYDCYAAPLRQALESGAVDMALVDESVRRVLRFKFEMGLFENPYVDAGAASAVFDTPDQRTLARTIAQKSFVLLKNEGDLLPLNKKLGCIAVIGPNANSARNLMGDYSYPVHIETLVRNSNLGGMTTVLPDQIDLVEHTVDMVTVLQGIHAQVSPETRVIYAQGCGILDESREGFAEAVEAARQADVAVMVMGDLSGLLPECTTGESRDRAELGLPGVQEDLVRAVLETGTPVVLVLVIGRPLTLTWMAEQVPAILVAWLPGEEGGNAVADVLFGDVNPGGKLPMAFPRAVGQIPVFYNHKPSGGRSQWHEHYVECNVKPLYPFGYGLSYTRFAVGNLRIGAAQATPGETVALSVDVTNTGERAGDEVIQFYTHQFANGVTRPVKELKGFARVSLQPGETRTVTYHLPVNQLGFYNRQNAYVVTPGTVDVMVGTSSTEIHCTGSFEITGPETDISATKAFWGEVSIR